jgi:molybdopterin molybdotransferase
VWWRVAIKPGRPVAMGEIGNAMFLGLPGNPVAAFVTFIRLARPVLDALGGALPRSLRPLPVRAGFGYRKKAGRREYVRVRLESGVAQRHEVEGAGIVTSLTRTDGLAEIADDVTRIEPGHTIAFLPYSALF